MKYYLNIILPCSFLFFLSFSLSASVKSSAEEIGDTLSSKADVNKVWNFDVYLDDDLIGFHRFEVEDNQGEFVVSSQAEFDVEFLFITVYDYKHNNTEVWKNDCLINLDSKTDDNGEYLYVRLQKKGSNSLIEASGASITETSCVRSFAYWNPELIKYSTLLNSQTGELINIEFSHVGKESFELKNKKIKSDHYQLRGIDNKGKDLEIDLWYTEDHHWLALRSKLENGSYLRYQLN